MRLIRECFAPASRVRLRALLTAACILVARPTVSSGAEGAWSAAVGTDPCGSELLLQQRVADDPSLRARRDLFERMVQAARDQHLIPYGPARPGAAAVAPGFMIPVAVHIVHQNGPENISDNQVQSQIYALNRDFANQPGNGLPAVDTGIQFCLASIIPNGSPVVWSTTPGITRDVSPQTNHVFQNQPSETALKAISYLPSNKYLNIWVVGNITGGGGGVQGYATFPGQGPPSLDGIVCRATAFGSNYTPWGNGFSLLPSNDDGKIMTHEAGHYFFLLHTFAGGCASPGDYIADTPPEAANHTGCPNNGLINCTQATDPIENFMDYTNDPCRFAFTAGQRTRMQAAIATWRSNLVDAVNLYSTGCGTGLVASIYASPRQACAGSPVNFSTPVGGFGYTYSWSFPGGTPATSNLQAVNVTYPTAGIYPALLTVTDGGPNYASSSSTVYVNACTPITGPCTNWVFGQNAALSFATGVPVAFAGTQVASQECSAMMSDNAGNLIIYTDGSNVYTSINTVMPNGTGLFAGSSSRNGVNIVKRPGSATQYYIFTVRQWEDGATANPLNYSVVDMTLNGGLGDIPIGQKNLLVSLPGGPTQMLEATALIPQCNGVDYWLVTHGAVANSGKIYVTALTSSGPGATTVYNIGMTVLNNAAGVLTPTADGTKFATVNLNNGQVAAYNFNRLTGAVTTLLAPTAQNAWADAALSPDGKLIYFSTLDYPFWGVRQMKLATLETRQIVQNSVCQIKPGPDGKLYLGSANQSAISCINFPNNFNTINQNECGLNLNSVNLPAGTTNSGEGMLPNFVVQCDLSNPAKYTYTQSNCLTVTFTATTCGSVFNWNFGDGNTGTGAVVAHTYAAQGTYNVSLTVGGASPPSIVQPVMVQMLPVTLAGPNTACASQANYSVISAGNYTYSWTLSGGLPANSTGTSVDVTWGPNGGTVTLFAVDPTTGCTTTLVKNVGPCPVCAPPPSNMVAWWPLDEPAGNAAIEIVLGNNAVDLNGPLHVNGMVKGSRQFNGTSTFLLANDVPVFNFGTGDFTVDAWVRTTNSSGFRAIVDKRYPDPEVGYSLYLRSGRLAFRIGAAVGGSVEYWNNTTPFVADGQWHHVAAVEQRATTPTGTRLYVDGVLVASFPAFNAGGIVSNSEKLLIGAGAPTNAPTRFWDGRIDEVELFARALSSQEIISLVQADSLGKCKEFLYVPTVANFCRDTGSSTLTLMVCNRTTAQQSYNLAFAGLPQGGPCTWTGPPAFQQLTPNPIVVPANSCVPVQYIVTRPPGMPMYTTSCYQVTMTNIVSLTSVVSTASMYASKLWCNYTIGPVLIRSGFGSEVSTHWIARNSSGGTGVLPYTIRVEAENSALEDSASISINGLPAGEEYHGTAIQSPGDSIMITASVQFTRPRPFRTYHLILEADENADGTIDNGAAFAMTYEEASSTEPVATPQPARPRAFRVYPVIPNPARDEASIRYELPARGRIQVGLFDIVGRRVRAIVDGVRDAGEGVARLDCRGVAQGVYFVKVEMAGESAVRRLVVIR